MKKMNWKLISTTFVIALSATVVVYFATTTGSVSNAAEPKKVAEPKKKAVMYKPLKCGCCDDYAQYLERHGFEVEVKSLRSLAGIKAESGVPKGFEGCHTLLVEGYTVDGLVPIGTLEKLLTERPDIKGITLPGMPWGAPGMEQRPKTGPLTIFEIPKTSSEPKVYAQE